MEPQRITRATCKNFFNLFEEQLLYFSLCSIQENRKRDIEKPLGCIQIKVHPCCHLTSHTCHGSVSLSFFHPLLSSILYLCLLSSFPLFMATPLSSFSSHFPPHQSPHYIVLFSPWFQPRSHKILSQNGNSMNHRNTGLGPEHTVMAGKLRLRLRMRSWTQKSIRK